MHTQIRSFMATSHTINFLRLLIAFAMPLQIVGQERIVVVSDSIVMTGYDAVIYMDGHNAYTTDMTHPYFNDYDIDLSVSDHVKNMELLIDKNNRINTEVKRMYIDNERYINTTNAGAIKTRKMLREQCAKRKFHNLQYKNTINKLKTIN